MTAFQLFIVLLLGYIGFLMAIGWYFSKRQNTGTDFWLAGKTAGTLSIGFSSAASWLTAGAILAVVGFFMLLGMGSVWGFVAPNIIALFIIALFVKKIKHLPAITQPELLELRYGSFLRVPVAIIITVVMVLFAVADIKGFAMVLEIFYGVSPVYAVFIVGLAVSVYVILGGLSAVIATDMIQFIFLSAFVLIMAAVVMSGASAASSISFSQAAASMPDQWWNPLSIGLPMVLIFVFAIVPGWITEQDPWQKVWAAKSEKSARNGMLLGSFLVAVVFGGCALIAVGLNLVYPEIARAGFPMGMANAEPALLNFIMGLGTSDLVLAFCAVGLATAAMSCADTFAASGASCISRDIYQRHFRPGASLREMLTINRVSVLLIVAGATLGTFLIDSIIEAIHVATYIASASYFFVLMGGLYWKRATSAGAAASMITGFVLQVGFVWIDYANTAPMGKPYLETIHPIFMGHGVIPAMAAGGLVLVVVSLLTKTPSTLHLAPFFKDEAERLVSNLQVSPVTGIAYGQDRKPVKKVIGDRILFTLSFDMGQPVNWKMLSRRLQKIGAHWIALGGSDALRRFVHPELLSCVAVTRGRDASSIWFEVESSKEEEPRIAQDMSDACADVVAALMHKETIAV
jgi:SSS family solute:Na+ symporter